MITQQVIIFFLCLCCSRPDTSFLWLTSPLKVMRHIIWKHHSGTILVVAMVLVVILVALVLIFTIPVSGPHGGSNEIVIFNCSKH